MVYVGAVLIEVGQLLAQGIQAQVHERVAKKQERHEPQTNPYTPKIFHVFTTTLVYRHFRITLNRFPMIG